MPSFMETILLAQNRGKLRIAILSLAVMGPAAYLTGHRIWQARFEKKDDYFRAIEQELDKQMETTPENTDIEKLNRANHLKRTAEMEREFEERVMAEARATRRT